MVPYLEMGGSNVSCIGTEGSNGSLFRNGWFQCFSVKELKVPMVPYLEMRGSNVSCIGTEGSKGFLLRNGCFTCFSV